MTDIIKIMFLGDIAGRPGRRAAKAYIADLSGNRPDFIIANAENASHGFGLTQKNYNELLSYGIDCFTSGNHIFDKRDIFNYIDDADRLIRPINYPKGTRGAGFRIFEAKKCKIGVINLLGRTFMPYADSYWESVEKALEEIKKETNVIFMDIHAEATAEKVCLARYYAEQGASFITGTHTHVQTADETILAGRCAYITDAGFCGAYDSVIGMDYGISLNRLKSMMPDRLDIAESETLIINGAEAEIDCASGNALSIKRINEKFTLEDNIIMKG